MRCAVKLKRLSNLQNLECMKRNIETTEINLMSSLHILQMKLAINKLDSELNKLEPSLSAKNHLEKNQGIINSKLTKFNNTIEEKIHSLLKKWADEIKG